MRSCDRKPEIAHARESQAKKRDWVSAHPLFGIPKSHLIVLDFADSFEQLRFFQTYVWMMLLVTIVRFRRNEAGFRAIVV